MWPASRPHPVSPPSILKLMLKNRLIAVYHVTSFLVLTVTALLKLSLIFDQSLYLRGQSQVVEFLTNRQVLILGGLLELAVVMYCRTVLPRMKSVMLLWLACLFSTYKIMEGPATTGKRCHCLGSLAETLKISETAEQNITWTILGFLAVGALLHLGYTQFASEYSPARLENHPDAI